MTADICELISKIEKYVMVRQLNIAEALAVEFRKDDSNHQFKESGYAILSIVLSYFEMIEQFMTGTTSKDRSPDYFLAGFRRVYPGTSLTDKQIRKIYGHARCGMYHDGMTKRQTCLSRWYPVGFNVVGGEVQINPGKVVEELRQHFTEYVQRLRDGCEPEWMPFQVWCNTLGVNEPDQSSTGTQALTTPTPWAQGQ